MNSNCSPAISVVMAVYNGEQFLGEAIESILNQAFSDFELIIVDDGSQDKTIEIIKSFVDSRIRLIRNECNMGLAASLNKGIFYSQGKYIARMDADDIAISTRLEKQYNYLEKNIDIAVLGSWIETFDEHQNTSVRQYPLKHDEILCEMLFRSPMAHPSVMFRKNIVQDCAVFYNSKYSKSEDYDLWTRLVKIYKFANLDEVLLKYRIHNEQIGSMSYRLQKKQSIRIAFNYLQSFGIKTSYHVLKNFILILKYKKTDVQSVKILFDKYKEKLIYYVEDINHIDTILGSYYRDILDFDEKLKEYLNILETIQDKREIILYGYGSLGKFLYTYMKKHNRKVKYVIDRNNYDDLGVDVYKRSIHDFFQEGNYVVINTVRDIAEFITLKRILEKKFSTSIVIP